MSFETQVLVRFAHVDPAGIVFYPRYFEMLNGAVEDWFAGALGMDFRTLHQDRRLGTPTAKLNVTFVAPSRLGDQLTIAITPRVVGRSSCTIEAVFTGDGQEKMRVETVLVCMDLDAQRAVPWPETIRERMTADLAPR